MTQTPIEEKLGELLRDKGLRLAVAEFCTGGLIGHRLTNVPGSSTYFIGGVTSYAYEAKVRLLGVRWETLESCGAVSRETVLEMARGVRQALSTDIGLSVSGIAGPGGGTPEKPVGFTWIRLSTPNGDQAWSYQFSGERAQIKQQASEQALCRTAEYLEDRASMQPVEVTARFDAAGQLIPLQVVQQGRAFRVESIGRRWQDESGRHILVMLPGARTVELIFREGELRWYLKTPLVPDRAA